MFSLFGDDESMLACNKSIFMKKLESLIPDNPITSINGADAGIIDANATFHMLQPPCGEN